MSNFTKKQHFVPEYYQKNFSDENGQIVVYKKKFGGFKKRYPAEILYKNYLYTLTVGSERTNEIESFYSLMESSFSDYVKVIDDLIRMNKSPDELKSMPEFIKTFKVMLAVQYWRMPNKELEAKKLAPNLVGYYDSAPDWIKILCHNDRKSIKNSVKMRHNSAHMKAIQFLYLPLLSMDMVGEDSNINFIISKDIDFITSDNPVCGVGAENDGFNGFADFIFPLSFRVAVVSKKYFLEDDVNSINSIIFNGATDFVLARTEEQLLAIGAKKYN